MLRWRWLCSLRHATGCLLLGTLTAGSLFSCHEVAGHARDEGEQGDTVVFRYARLIHAVRYSDRTEVTVDNPWKPGKVLHRYTLFPHRDPDARPHDDPDARPHRGPDARPHRGLDPLPHRGLDPRSHGDPIITPLRRSIIFTSVHAALADQLGAQRQVAGVADLKYIKVPFVQEGCRSGRLADCGDGMNPQVETIIDAGADAILLSPFENSGGYGRLEEVGIPLVECAEYMESSPLARAEWMRFYGMLFGRERQADSLFAVVDSSYHALCRQAKAQGEGRSVLVDKQTGSVWYVPGGQSTIGRMLVDAGARYAFASDSHGGSLPLPFETVLEKAGESQVWLFRYDADRPITLERLLGEQPGYRQLRPVRDGQVYGCNVMTSMFYEESPFRPDLLLQDFISIVHPGMAGTAPLRYYHLVE